MTIYFIRHGMTQGNLERRYIGSTDEPLCEEGKAALRGYAYPPADAVYCSPMRRCLETAAILYPDQKPTVVADFRECDFGRYEGKNYAQLTQDAPYLKWVESGGVLPFPDGEDTSAFRARCASAFLRVAGAHRDMDTLALVVHGGTIMSILSAFEPSHDYFRWQCPNGHGYSASFSGEILMVTGEI